MSNPVSKKAWRKLWVSHRFIFVSYSPHKVVFLWKITTAKVNSSWIIKWLHYWFYLRIKGGGRGLIVLTLSVMSISAWSTPVGTVYDLNTCPMNGICRLFDCSWDVIFNWISGFSRHAKTYSRAAVEFKKSNDRDWAIIVWLLIIISYF